MSMKKPLTPPGIEPATFRFVAQQFHYRVDRYVHLYFPYLTFNVKNKKNKFSLRLYC